MPARQRTHYAAVVFIAVVLFSLPTQADDAFKYTEGRHTGLFGTVLYYEVAQDYRIDLKDKFAGTDALPAGRWLFPRDWGKKDSQITHLKNHVNSLPDKQWDFVKLTDGVLTIKQGYRWDGASTPWNELDVADNRAFYLRGSCVHDSLYDMMRMNYLDADHTKRPNYNDAGFKNRLMADCVMQMIFDEDRGKKSNFEFRAVRGLGKKKTHKYAKNFYGRPMLAPWKYHISKLDAWEEDGNVHLHFKSADEEKKDLWGYFSDPHVYNVWRHEVLPGEGGDPMDWEHTWIGDIKDYYDNSLPGDYYDKNGAIHFTDTTVDYDKTYSYFVCEPLDYDWPLMSGKWYYERYDWSNFKLITVSSKPTTVPEPTSMALLGLGVALVIGHRRRRHLD